MSSLGVALFDRSGGRLVLTRAGERLLLQAEALLAAGHELLGNARRMQGELSGRVELGMPGESAEFLRLAGISAGAQRDLPLVELATRSGPAGELLDLARGGVLAGLPWFDGSVDSHVHPMLRALFEQQGLTPNVVLRNEDTRSLEMLVREASGCALLREEVALAGVQRGQWMVWGHARVDAQLFFSTAPDRAGDPLAVALTAVVQAAWQ
jgi:DNA-binding transcriptional LysR family regulator